jgi:hypothetical protein
MVATFLLDLLALYGLVILIDKYYPNLPRNITFDMIAVALLVFRVLRAIVF